MRGWLDKIKSVIIYDADKEFYAKVFPDSVQKKDLLRLRIMTHADLPSGPILKSSRCYLVDNRRHNRQ